MKNNKIIYLGILIAIFAIQATQSSAQSEAKLEMKIEGIFLKTASGVNVHNATFKLYSDDHHFDINIAEGRRTDGTINTIETPFHTTSVTKTLTAAAIAMLVDQGLASFDDPIHYYLPANLVNELHVFEGQDYAQTITIHQLLSHTSGLADYWEDEPISGMNMMELLAEKPGYFWQPEELISFTKQHFTARFVPGTDYHYSDTGYVLLGLIIQHLSNVPLHEYFTEHIFKPLNMNSSYMHLRSKPIAGDVPAMAEMYADDAEISGLVSLSADWGGGGVASTSADLQVFLESLLEGKLVKPETLAQMQQWAPESKGTNYGYGLRQWDLQQLFPTLPKLSLIGHSGTSGAYMYYCSELDTYLTGTFNQTEFRRDHLVFLMKKLMQVSNHIKTERRKS